MENQEINLNVENSNWEENDNFSTNQTDEIVDNVSDSVKGVKNLVVDESRVLAPSIVKVFKESDERLKQEQKPISFLPNTILYYGLMGGALLLTYKLIKKLA